MNGKSKVRKKVTSTLFAIVCVAVFMSMLPTVQVQAASPSLSAKSITLNLKQSKTLKVKNNKKKVRWSTKNKSIASVNENGKVTAKGLGNTVIYAKVGNKKLSCKVKVVNADANPRNLTYKVKNNGDFVRGNSVTVSFMLDKSSTNVKIMFINASNYAVYTKVVPSISKGKTYTLSWNGKNSRGNYVSTGGYKVCIQAGNIKTYTGSIRFVVQDFAGGDGSTGNPYQVKTWSQLQKVAKHNGRCFKQVADINANGDYLTPMFSEDMPFSGIYDGNGYTISGIVYEYDTDRAGIFNTVSGIIRNLNVEKCKFSGNYHTGIIAGVVNDTGMISNCSVKNSTVDSKKGKFAGGICGYNYGKIVDCIVTATSISVVNQGYNYNYAGGISGLNNSGVITECNVIGCNVTCGGYFGSYSGGICGENYYGTVSYSNVEDCEILGKYVAGICGNDDHGTYEDNSYIGNLGYGYSQ